MKTKVRIIDKRGLYCNLTKINLTRILEKFNFLKNKLRKIGLIRNNFRKAFKIRIPYNMKKQIFSIKYFKNLNLIQCKVKQYLIQKHVQLLLRKPIAKAKVNYLAIMFKTIKNHLCTQKIIKIQQRFK